MVQRIKAPKRNLQQLAEKASSYFMMGYERDNPFSSFEEAKEAWQLVKAWYCSHYTIGAIDKFGYINYLPEAWWMFDCPEAPFQYEKIEGLDWLRSKDYQRHQALQRWGIIPMGTPDASINHRANEIEVYYQRKVTNSLGGFWYPFRTATSEADKEAKWEEIKAERAAWVRLGYLTA